jgi:hypothetical protein
MPRSCYYWCFSDFCFYCLDIGCFRKFCHLFHARWTGHTYGIGNKILAYILFYLAFGFETEGHIFEFMARLLLVQLCLSLIFRELLAALGSVLRALCCFVERSSLLLLDFFHYIACRNSFYNLFGRIYLRSCIFHKASRSQIVVLEFLSFKLEMTFSNLINFIHILVNLIGKFTDRLSTLNHLSKILSFEYFKNFMFLI